MNNNIEYYHTQREWKTYKAENENTNLTIGFELEVENFGNEDNNEVAGIIKNVLNGFVAIERDGSLNNGFEIISHPFTRKYFETIKPQLKQAFGHLNACDFRGDETSTAGLHVHINKLAFGNTYAKQNENINKLFLFFETYKKELLKFSRRRGNECERWACWFSDARESDHANGNDKKIKSLKFINDNKANHERYRAINLTKGATVEVRIFKSSLNFETFCGTLELIFTIMENINGSLSKLSWNNIINDKKNYDLYNYCVRRNIADNTEKMIDYSKLLERMRKTQRKEFLTAYNRIIKYLNYIDDHKRSYLNKLMNNKELSQSALLYNYSVFIDSLEKRTKNEERSFTLSFYNTASIFLRNHLSEIINILTKYETELNDDRASVHLKNLKKEFGKIRQLKEVV